MDSAALPNGLLKINGDRINPAQDETVQAAAGIVTTGYDYFSVSYPSNTQEIYTFKSGGASGTVVATVTITYVDSTKAQISSALRT
jgi:hypothetical protein